MRKSRCQGKHPRVKRIFGVPKGVQRRPALVEREEMVIKDETGDRANSKVTRSNRESPACDRR